MTPLGYVPEHRCEHQGPRFWAPPGWHGAGERGWRERTGKASGVKSGEKHSQPAQMVRHHGAWGGAGATVTGVGYGGGGPPRSGSQGTQGRLPHPRIPWAFGQESRSTSHKSRVGLSPGMFRHRKKGPWFRSRAADSGGAGLSPRRLLKSPAVSLPSGSRRCPGPGATSGCREGASWPQGARGLGWGLRARTLDFARGGGFTARRCGGPGTRGASGGQVNGLVCI